MDDTPYRIRTFNEVIKEAKNLPKPVPLFGDLFFKNEVSILAGETGVGKSILAVHIGIQLAKHLTII